MKFRKKPVVVEAFQFMGHESGPDLDWFVAAVNAGKIMRHRTEKICGSDWLEVHTMEGRMSAGLRDWIIRGVQGEIYPCKPDIFAATYEPVEEGEIPVNKQVQCPSCHARLTTAADIARVMHCICCGEMFGVKP